MVEQSDEVLTGEPSRPRAERSVTVRAEGTEERLAGVLAGILHVDRVPPESHFFDDLGANSLVMAHFCARLRKREDLPTASIRDIYRYPTIRSLATALGTAEAVAAESTASAAAAPDPVATRTESSSVAYVACGAVQVLIFVAYAFGASLVAVRGYTWLSAGSGFLEVYVRSVTLGAIAFLGLCLVPVVAKWLLMGRCRPGEFPVWGLAYVRFWTIRALLHANPMVLLVGNPLYVLYLRALGARIGRGVTILSPHVPVFADLLTIGDGTVIRKDAFFSCYRGHDGRIQTGRVTLGRDAFIGEKTVLDIDTSMGDGSQLGHTSSLHPGDSIPDGQRWHGSPAQRTDLDYVRVAPATCGTLRRAGYGAATLAQILLVYMPLAVSGLSLFLHLMPGLNDLLAPGAGVVTSSRLFVDSLLVSLVLFTGFIVLAVVAVLGLPRLLRLLIEPDKVYPLYGVHYSVERTVERLTNAKFFTWLFGDSSYIVYYLQALGYDLSRVEQTGSNFGTEVGHGTPYLSAIGRGTMVADGLSIVNTDFSSTSFRVAQVSIGPHNFVGNNIAYPAGGRTGENCLLATKVMIPMDGPVREGVGLLGSPCFEIPRTVDRDTRFDHFRTGAELERRLRGKNRYNLVTMAVHLFLRWVHVFLITVLALAAVDVAAPLMVVASLTLSMVVTPAYFVLVERAIGRFRPLSPQLCSIYEPYFWWHERLWKVPDTYLNVFDGTPFKNVIWRLLGVRIGRRVFDDGCYLTERTLTTIGDDAMLNHGSKLQCHSQEDGTFKSEPTTVGAGATLGVGAFVHYGVTIGEGAAVAADSFLMKGEEVPAYARWAGNPATDSGRLRDRRDQVGASGAALTRAGGPSGEA